MSPPSSGLKNEHEANSKKSLLHGGFLLGFNPDYEAICSSVRSVDFRQTTRRYVTKELVLLKCFTEKKLCLNAV
jgi:hypothetical protein